MNLFFPKAPCPAFNPIGTPWTPREPAAGSSGEDWATDRLLQTHRKGGKVPQQITYARPKIACDHLADFAGPAAAVGGLGILSAATLALFLSVSAAEPLNQGLQRAAHNATIGSAIMASAAVLSGAALALVGWNEPAKVQGELIPRGEDVYFHSDGLPAPQSLSDLGEKEYPASGNDLTTGQYPLQIDGGSAVALPTRASSPLAALKVNDALHRLRDEGGMGKSRFESGDLSYASYGPGASSLSWNEGEKSYIARFLPPEPGPGGKTPSCLLSVLPTSRLDELNQELDLSLQTARAATSEPADRERTR